MDERFLPDWDNDQLSLGKPHCMDTLTLIEWIERQLETEQETRNRHEFMRELYKLWHGDHQGIYGCCINGGFRPLLTINERRTTKDTKLYDQALEAFRNYRAGGLMVLPEGVSVTPLNFDPPTFDYYESPKEN